ncbi:MAG: rhodanese-like domain-containing protein [Candidatus Nanopelagicales bacterium]
MGFFSNLFARTPVPSAAELQAQGAKVIDVRSRAEFSSGHVAGARNLDVSAPNFASQVKGLNKRHTYVVYCQSGGRSRQAAGVLKSAGLTVIDGGGIGKMKGNGWPLGR